MLKYTPMHKLDKVDDKGGGGGNPPATEPKEQSNSAAGDPPAEAQGDNFDDFGYPKAAEGTEDKSATEEKKASDEEKDPVEESEEVVEPVSGYGDEPPKVEDAPAKPEEKKEDPKPEPDDLDKAIGEGLSEADAKEIKKIATEEGLTPKQTKRLADIRREEFKAAQKYAADQEKEAKNAQIRLRADWHNELKNDKDFGGENFKKNLQRVDKVLADHMPSTKKMLTDRKGVLPPWLMRDLAKLGNTLYANDKLVHGGPTVPKVEDKAVDDALDFYE